MIALQSNPTLPLMTDSHNTIIDALVYASKSGNGFNFYNDRVELTDVITYKELLDGSYASSLLLKEKLFNNGVSNDSVAIFAETSADFLRIFLGCQFIKVLACPVSFQIFSVKHNDYVKRFFEKLLGIGINTFVVPDSYVQFLQEETKAFADKITVYPYSAVINRDSDIEYDHSTYDGFKQDESAYIQLTSGSTSLPKALLFSQKNIATNIKEIHRDGLRLSVYDRSLCWLPFSHSIAMFGFMVGSIYCHRAVDFFSPADFLKNPLMWIELISRNKITLTCAPSFGYQMVLDAYAALDNKDEKQYDLSSLKSMGIGGDITKIQLLENFTECFKPYGFEENMFNPSYGLTETTLAVSHLPVLSDIVTKSVTINGVDKVLVSAGFIHKSFKARILNKEGNPCQPNEIGELWVAGPAVIEKELSGDSLAIRQMDGINYLDTGDLVFLDENNYLYITGRKKEIVIVRGKNISLVEIDELVSREVTLLDDNKETFTKFVSIFIDDANFHSDKVVIVVETHDKDKTELEFSTIKNKLKVLLSIDIELVCVEQGFISLTSSGKISREETKQKLLDSYRASRGQNE